MTYSLKYTFILSLTFLIAYVVKAQEQQPTEGEIEGRQVVIEKNLEITLPNADRNFEKVPPPAEPSGKSENLRYEMEYVDNSAVPDLDPSLRVLKIKTERPPLLYENYAKLGFGNYLSPYLAVYLHRTPNKKASYGANFFHHSAIKGPVDGKNSGNGVSQIEVNGSFMGDKATVGADLGYGLETFRFYGYDSDTEVDRDTIKQIFNSFNIGLTVDNSDVDSKLRLTSGLNFSYKNDDYGVSESAFILDLGGYYPLSEEIGAGLDLDLDFRTYKAASSLSRNLINIKPYFTYKMDLLQINAGFRIVSNNDSLSNVNAIAIFPAVTADYFLSDALIIFGMLDGNVEKVNFNNITSINPYIKTDQPFFNSIKSLEIGGGIRGTLTNNLGYKASATFSGYKNLYFFVNDAIETNKFNVLYDTGNSNILKLQAGLTYSVEQKYGAEIGIKYFGYSTANVAEAWHRPKTDVNVSGWYNLYDKILISTDLRLLSGIQALDPVTSEAISLDAAFDWNAEINYRFSEQAGAFIMLNNLAGGNYETLYRYPVRGLQVKLGVSLSF